MEKEKIISSLSTHGNGEIYLGVVGAVRCGKSTFIKRFIENLVVPNIEDEYEKKKCLDELPQSASGKTIMTTEPKFVPSSGAKIKVNEFETNIKLVDCVGYVVDGATGFCDEAGNPRMVKCPWFDDAIPFVEAAEVGTEKVIKDHATIGIVITTDGSFGEIKREAYAEVEEKVITELTSIGKPFIVLLNSATPKDSKAISIAKELEEKYDVSVKPINIIDMGEDEILDILKTALYEFPVSGINVSIPEWIHILNNDHDIKKEYLDRIRESVLNVSKIKDVDSILEHFNDSEFINKSYISNLDTSTSTVTINLEASDELYNNTLNEVMGSTVLNKANVLKLFSSYKNDKEEMDIIKQAMRMAKSTGYGIIYPGINDMKLEAPEIIKQGSRFGIKLKAVASSIHLMRVNVESTFEPIIGTEMQSKELIDYIMKDYETDPSSIWQSEIFGRSLENIVSEGIKAKLSMMPDNTRFKLGDTVTKIVNKGSNTLIAFVL